MIARKALSRSSLALRQVRRSDLYHFENKDGSHLPFSVKNKTAFAIKFTAACTFAASLPVLCKFFMDL
ncbi:hypothetical protein K502DRAFT_364731 [Neoconidiobolus thromboides FSU 785]|nr:hypothetical protein K502DRAFT_364731 [Neoconidiobolus thromboides FSU 785]